METLQTIIVEDEGPAIRRLQKFALQNKSLNVVGVAKSGKEAIDLLNLTKAELILLDIELKDMTAFDVLSNINLPFNGQIIFITAFNQYAVDAFEIAATDYLLKPYDKDRFNKAIQRAQFNQNQTDIKSILRLLEKNPEESFFGKIAISEGTRTHYYKPEDIIWIEADGYYCNIHKLNASTLLVRKTLKEMATMLPSNIFFRVNRSAIINKNHIEKEENNISQKYIYLEGGVKIKKSTKYEF